VNISTLDLIVRKDALLARDGAILPLITVYYFHTGVDRQDRQAPLFYNKKPLTISTLELTVRRDWLLYFTKNDRLPISALELTDRTDMLLDIEIN
jgi:hypothetical protein